jgi:hypothetical protein
VDPRRVARRFLVPRAGLALGRFGCHCIDAV